jgi:adenine phosphoribosyltransferase
MENEIKKAILDVPDFPKKGIIFKDLTPIFEDKNLFKKLIRNIAKRYKGKKIDKIVCVEARGFLFGAPLAYEMGTALVPVRKPGKLPRMTHRVEYDLEYGKDALEIHQDAIKPGDNVLIIDDLLATGGTVGAVAKLVEKCGGKVFELAFVVELDFLKGRDKLKNYTIFSIVHY